MRVLLISIGTRGDIEPFIAIGEMLAHRGHEVHYAFPAQLCTLLPAHAQFSPLSPMFIELVASKEGRAVMTGEGGFFRRLSHYFILYKKGMEVNKLLVIDQKQVIEEVNPDKIVYHPKSTYPLVYGMLNGKKNMMVSPVPYVVHRHDDHPHLGFGSGRWKWWNRFSYRVGRLGFVKGLKMSILSFEGHKRITSLQIINHLKTEPFTYLVSSTLYKGPEGNNEHIKVLGFLERMQAGIQEIDDTLLAFLQQHSKVILLTFGSMINSRPGYTTEVFLNVFSKLKIPAIINTGFGGLEVPDAQKNNPQFHFTQQMPYSQILPKVYAIIHHGGTGTTQSGLLHGCATMIIPHLIDQFMWNQRIADLGAGPKGIAIKDISIQKLEALVKDLWNNPVYKKNAAKLSLQMRKENFTDELYDFLTRTS